MTQQGVAKKLHLLRAIRGFPHDSDVLEVIAKHTADWFVDERIHNGKKYGPEAQLDLLLESAIRHFRFWEGIPQLRDLMEALFPPQYVMPD